MADTSNFERKTNTSQNVVIPKRLSFDFLNSSGGGGAEISKKRKLNEASVYVVEDETFQHNRTFNETLNSSTGSSIAGSSVPWETKMLRIDLMEAQTQVSN